MKFKKSVALATVIFLCVTNFARADNAIPEQFVNPNPPNSSTSTGVWFNDDINLTRIPTSLYSVNPKTGEALSFCSGLNDSKCATASQFNYNALLPPCSSIADVDCIESLYAVAPNSSEKTFAVVNRMIPANVGQGYQADPKNGLPQGSNSHIWTIPGLANAAGTDQYALVVTRMGSIMKTGDGRFSSKFGSFRAGIYPVTDVTNSAYRANIATISSSNRYGILHPSQTEFRSCAIVGDAECALRQGFPSKTQFGVNIRLSAKLTGWLHGRIDQPRFDYKLTDYGTHLQIQGFPHAVPSLAGWVDENTLTSGQKVLLDQLNQGRSLGVESNPLPTGDYSINSLNTWLELLGNKATVVPEEWVFHSLDDGELQSASTCITQSESLAGFVTTNATTYAAGAPVFNKNDQSLDYRVAAPHFAQDGRIFQGSYDLYLASQVARCIYGFTAQPIKATISIIDGSGGSQVATTSITQSDGWLHLAAKGFTFSTPNLKVKLTQDAPVPSPTPTASVLSTSSPNPTVTLTNSPSPIAEAQIGPEAKPVKTICVRGKIKKTVIGIKCPIGYKRSK